MFVVVTALAASPAACALGLCLTYQACEQWPVTANKKKKCLEKYFCLVPLSQNVLPFIFSSHLFWPKFGTPDHGLQTGRWGKEGSVSTAHPATHVGETLHSRLGRRCLCHLTLHVHAYQRTCIFSSLPMKRKTEIVNSLPCSPLNSRFFLQSSHCIVA